MGMRYPNQIRDPEREERRKLIEQKIRQDRLRQDERDFGGQQPYQGQNYGIGDAAMDMAGAVGSGIMEGGSYLLDKILPSQQPQAPQGWHPPMAMPRDPGMTVGHAKAWPPATPSNLGPMNFQDPYGSDDPAGLDPFDVDPNRPELNDSDVDISPMAYDDEGLGDSPMAQMDFDPRANQPMARARGMSPSQIPYMNLLMKSAAQAGTIGSKAADTSGFDEYSDNLVKQEDQRENRRNEIENYILKARGAGKDPAFEREKFEYQKTKDDKDREARVQGYNSRNDYQNAMLAATLGKNADQAYLDLQKINQQGELARADDRMKRESIGIDRDRMRESERHNKEMEKISSKNAETAAERARKNGENLDPSTRAYLTDLSKRNAQRIGILNDIKSFKQQFINAKSPQEKYNVGQAMLKTMNSLQGPDALGVDESRRMASDLENVDFARLMRGERPIGMNANSFLKSIDSRINAIGQSIQSSQAEIDNITGGGTPGQTTRQQGGGSKPRVQYNRKTNQTRYIYPDGRIEVKNGTP